MQVVNSNNVKIYNLSSGKSLPEWLSDRKKRTLQKQDQDLRKRIQLIQDFEMPTISNNVQMSADGQFILATGLYKPRVKCFDVNQMSMKFERCMDVEVLKFHLLSEDYTKIIFLQSDRYIEFHSQHGRYYRTRIPSYGRDMSYMQSMAELYFVGASSEVMRLNLELGRFMNPLKSNIKEFNCCKINPIHELFIAGSNEGTIVCWDHRTRESVGNLNCAQAINVYDNTVKNLSISSLNFFGSTTLATGLSTGHILLYDLRMGVPLLIKDHNNGLPIKDLEFYHNENSQNLILSIDKRILKIWEQNTGNSVTSIEPEFNLNDLCVVPNSGLLFIANESPKILTYYIPELGQAPKWCSTLTSITEELEENMEPEIYDDYKFLTRQEVDELGLTHLIGSNLLRAEIHGYYVRMQIYHKAKAAFSSNTYADFKRKALEKKLQVEERIQPTNQVLPNVNRNLAEKFLNKKESKKKPVPNILGDSRFSEMFTNENFEIDEESTEFQLLKPVVSRLDKLNRKKMLPPSNNEDKVEDDKSEESDDFNDSSSSDDDNDDQNLREELREQHRIVNEKKKLSSYNKAESHRQSSFKSLNHRDPKFFEMRSTQFSFARQQNQQLKQQNFIAQKKSMGDRLEECVSGIVSKSLSNSGNAEMTFTLKKKPSELNRRLKIKEHRQERKKIRRPAGKLHKFKT